MSTRKKAEQQIVAHNSARRFDLQFWRSKILHKGRKRGCGHSRFEGVRQDALIVHTMVVSRTKRKRGVGFFALLQAEKSAKQMKLPQLELEVLKRNVPAQRLYWKFGFRIYAKRRLTLVLRKPV